MTRGRAALTAVLAASLVACTDRMPTLTDVDRLPADRVPVTIQHTLTADEFLINTITIRGETDSRDSDDLVVASSFDDGLDAHILAQFNPLPDTIHFDGAEADFAFGRGEIRSSIPDSLAISASQLTFYLWELTEPWDSTATWTEAVSEPESQPWAEPGGTRGELLSIATWNRSATGENADSVVWPLSRQIVENLAAVENPSFMITLEDVSARAEIAPLRFVVEIEPLEDPDTTLTRTIGSTEQIFIYTPDAPSPDLARVGGVTSDRTLLHMRLPEFVPGCQSGACEPVRLQDVTLNRVILELDPEPVTMGFRPVESLPITVRQLLEPDLGESAPLGPALGGPQFVPAERFVGGNESPFDLIITSAVGRALAVAEGDAADEREFGIALTVEPEASSFAYAWFDRSPRLQFVYTLRPTMRVP